MIHYIRYTSIGFLLVIALTADISFAQSLVLDEVRVTAPALSTPTRQADERVYTGTAITTLGIENQGASANMRVYEAISNLPGVFVESANANSLGAEQSSMRLRGVRSYLGALTVEGVPNYGGNPIGPRDYLYDMENMQAISIYKGATPANIGTGVGSRAGAIVLHPKWPSETFSWRIKQGFGADQFMRTYARIDSGTLGQAATRLSFAASRADAQKWRGAGDLGPRNNVNLGLWQDFGEHTIIKLWFNHNELKQHLYRPLSYAQTQALGDHYRTDYHRHRTFEAIDDIYYYQYNRGHYQNHDLISVIQWQARDNIALSFKPYYSVEDTHIYQGVMARTAMVQRRTRDIERYGIIAEATFEADPLQVSLGYHIESSDMNIYNQNYAPLADGLAYRGYGVLGTTGTTSIQSPYLKLAGTKGRFNWQAGIKYFYFQDSDSKGYITGDDFQLLRAIDLDRASRTYDIWLPTLGLSFDLNDSLTLQTSYGRNFIRPYAYMPLVNLYNTHRPTFLAANVSLQDLFDGYDLEYSNTLDLGLRYQGAYWDIMPTVFWAHHHNLLTTVSDARLMFNDRPLSYRQNTGQASSYGIELAVNAYLSDSLTAFVNSTYIRFTYDQDLEIGGVRLASKGRQLIDTPHTMVRTGLIYHQGELEIIPRLRYLAARYGDVLHQERIDSYTVFDLDARYTFANVWKNYDLQVGLELNNLFDKRYIAVIDAFDDNHGRASYHPGSPFTAMLNLGLTF